MRELSLPLKNGLKRALGSAPRVARRLSGGDINDAFEVTLADGRAVFVKANVREPAGMFRAEAHGLAWLSETRALRLPEVFAVSEAEDEVGFLVLELIRPGAPRARHDEQLGRGLSVLHRAGAAGFGLDHPNFIGSLPQSNRPHPSWAEFYRCERLEPQLELAARQGRASAAMRHGFERLFPRLAELSGPEEPPARVHGDLWSGNLHTAESGEPCLIDPSAYGGHREMDLAMMRLFGGFGRRVFDAYAESFPLFPGHERRVPLFQLYPLMVHVNLFGGGYGPQVEAVLARYA